MLRKANANGSIAQEAGNKSGTSMAQRLAKRRKISTKNEYMNLNFILGSCAKVERFFSAVKYFSTDIRSRMMPHLFEAICFLKANKDLWDATTFQEASNISRKKRTEECIQAHEAMEMIRLEDNCSFWILDYCNVDCCLDCNITVQC